MALLRRDLTGAETLVSVVGDVAAQLAEARLGRHHILVGGFLAAVDAGDEKLLIGFAVVLHIADRVGQIVVEILSELFLKFFQCMI